MKYVLLCAGKGTRMKADGVDTPKPLLPLNSETTILDFHIQRIYAQDPSAEIIIITGNDTDVYEKKFKHSVFVKVVRSTAGTFGALEAIKELLTDGDKYIVLIFADNVSKFNYVGLARFAEQGNINFVHFLRKQELPVDEYVLGQQSTLGVSKHCVFTIPGVFIMKTQFMRTQLNNGYTSITHILDLFGGNFISHNEVCINVNTKKDYELAKLAYEKCV